MPFFFSHYCLPKWRHSDATHEFQECYAQKCSRGWGGSWYPHSCLGGMAWNPHHGGVRVRWVMKSTSMVGVGWVMKSTSWLGGVGHEIHIMVGWGWVMKSTSWCIFTKREPLSISLPSWPPQSCQLELPTVHLPTLIGVVFCSAWQVQVEDA